MTETLDRPSNYQARDVEVVDYRMTELAGTGLMVRGPVPDLSRGDHITCIGAAQTFGCFCEHPYPDLLGRALDRPVLNLGFGGIGPGFVLRRPELIDIANKGALTVVQVLSGRVQPNMFFEGLGLTRVRMRRNGKLVHPHGAWRDIAEGFHLWTHAPSWAQPAVRGAVRAAARAPLALALAQSRAGWVAHEIIELRL